eukprot:m.199909 g.199909  ORF g.199909 m.199909 type:complete len:126 (+) comp10100_c0_seq16:149-526(+)
MEFFDGVSLAFLARSDGSEEPTAPFDQPVEVTIDSHGDSRERAIEGIARERAIEGIAAALERIHELRQRPAGRARHSLTLIDIDKRLIAEQTVLSLKWHWQRVASFDVDRSARNLSRATQALQKS